MLLDILVNISLKDVVFEVFLWEDLLTLGEYAQRGLQYLVRKRVCLSVRLSACLSVTFFATTRKKPAKEREYIAGVAVHFIPPEFLSG